MRDEHVFASGGFTVKSLNQIKEVAPSVFTEGQHPGLSKRYSRISTVDIVKGLSKHGWEPISARQVGEGKYGRHIIRLSNKKSGIISVKRDDVIAQMIVDNSLDGTSPADLSAGVFRAVCGNGLTVGIPGLTSNYSFRHMGIDEKSIREIVEKAIQDFGQIQEHIVMMQDYPLADKQKLDFAVKAVNQRDSNLYVNEKGKMDVRKLKRVNDLEQLLTPTRQQDESNSLWTTFNIVQEKLVTGGYKRISEKGRSVTVQGIGNPVRNVSFNRDLWNLAETYLPKS